jgi:hypothetical protein
MAIGEWWAAPQTKRVTFEFVSLQPAKRLENRSSSAKQRTGNSLAQSANRRISAATGISIRPAWPILRAKDEDHADHAADE